MLGILRDNNLTLSGFEYEVLLALFALFYNILAFFVVLHFHWVNNSLQSFRTQILGQKPFLKWKKQLNSVFLALWVFWRGKILHAILVEYHLLKQNKQLD